MANRGDEFVPGRYIKPVARLSSALLVLQSGWTLINLVGLNRSEGRGTLTHEPKMRMH